MTEITVRMAKMILVERRGSAYVPFFPFLFLGFVAILGLILKIFLPGWILMWVLAAFLFLTFKGFSVLAASANRVPERLPHGSRELAIYFASWPDMNARAYFDKTAARRDLTSRDWLGVIVKTVAGAVCLFGITRNIYGLSPFLAGWFGLAGFICFLHFGIFSILALAWQSAGMDAGPVMNRPALARSVSEFWNRWNIPFRQIAHAFVFKPAIPVLGTQGAMFITFLFSGLLHDLLISFPAGGGYGLPTLYFLIQSGGVVAERSAIGARVLRESRRRLFAALIVVAPVSLLFHRPFIKTVIIPFLSAIGAL